MLLDAGGVPWWAFLMMPVMMLGMGLMMWLMMQMMMGTDHGSGHASPSAADSEAESLRRQVEALQQRLTAMESSRRGQPEGDNPPHLSPNEGDAPAAEEGERE